MYRLASYVLLAIFVAPLSASAAAPNVGFVQGLWYATEPVFANIPNRVYVAFRNTTPDDLTGTIQFTVNGTSIGSSDIRVLGGRVTEVWVDWTPTLGEQKVSAAIENVQLHRIGEAPVTSQIAGLTVEDTRTIDVDSDGDGIGNMTDTDDDNDGSADEDEIKNGTDPLVAEEKKETPREPEKQASAVSNASAAEGLERYLDSGTTEKLLSSMTEQIQETKKAIDTYREERAQGMTDDLVPMETRGDDGAVITRTTIEHPTTFWDKLRTGFDALIAHIWTFMLWIVSNVLAHPIVVQLTLLLSILYGLFYTARRLGGRPRF